MKQKIVLLAIVFAIGNISIMSFAAELDEDLSTEYPEDETVENVIVDESGIIYHDSEIKPVISEENTIEKLIRENTIEITKESIKENFSDIVTPIETIDDEETCEHIDEDNDEICDICENYISKGLKEEEAIEKEATEQDYFINEVLTEDLLTQDALATALLSENVLTLTATDNSLENVECEHIDEDGDGICDNCSETLEEIADEEEVPIPTGIDVVITPFLIMLIACIVLIGAFIKTKGVAYER